MNIEPTGELAIRVVAMPKDTNPAGDVFGGWLLSQMDLAGGVFCRKIAKGRVVTIKIESTTFNAPVFIGDTLCCYVSLVKIGRTSITTHIEAYVNRDFEDTRIKVTEGNFKYVKMDENKKPTPIEQAEL
ncbi:MAG: acyl-CoA thioesterase [Flavobacteriales bacterium]|jgi:acyl-CoA thioesterase YciA